MTGDGVVPLMILLGLGWSFFGALTCSRLSADTKKIADSPLTIIWVLLFWPGAIAAIWWLDSVKKGTNEKGS